MVRLWGGGGELWSGGLARTYAVSSAENFLDSHSMIPYRAASSS